MKILIVNTSDIDGGAARAAYRLHQALLKENIESQMLVQSKASDDYRVLAPETKLKKGFSRLRPILDSLPVYRYKSRTKTLFSPAYLPFSDVVKRINTLEPDIVHLHWVSGGMIRIEDIEKIKAPIVWSLHDMWAFTGGCHYDEECRGYKSQCGFCKVLGSKKEKDLSSKVFQRKLRSYSQISNLTVVGLSRWLAKEAQQSQLFKNTSAVNLPNPIDTTTFSPVEKAVARDVFNLPQNKKLILFGAMGAMSDPRKGFEQLSIALEGVDTENTELVIFGSSEPQTPQAFKQKAHYLGHLHDDVSLRVLYSAADVMVVPSLQENLSNAIMESLACGTPVVGFDIGGNSDLIDHRQNGYLAKPFYTGDLAKGIEWILGAGNDTKLGQNARDKVLREFDSKVVAGRYIELYRNILNRTSKRDLVNFE
jgi:glycosyltransferase involved in cell wall biosynthesis